MDIDLTTIAWILAGAIALLGLLLFLSCSAQADLERRLSDALHRAVDAENSRLNAEHKAQTLRCSLEMIPVPTLQRYQRRRVVVNAVGGSRAWRGVLRDEIVDDEGNLDALVLDPCDVLERTGREAWASEPAPGDVVIPAGRIDFVQVIRDDDE